MREGREEGAYHKGRYDERASERAREGGWEGGWTGGRRGKETREGTTCRVRGLVSGRGKGRSRVSSKLRWGLGEMGLVWYSANKHSRASHVTTQQTTCSMQRKERITHRKREHECRVLVIVQRRPCEEHAAGPTSAAVQFARVLGKRMRTVRVHSQRRSVCTCRRALVCAGVWCAWDSGCGPSVSMPDARTRMRAPSSAHAATKTVY
jgi:hypothetical protein